MTDLSEVTIDLEYEREDGATEYVTIIPVHICFDAERDDPQHVLYAVDPETNEARAYALSGCNFQKLPERWTL